MSFRIPLSILVVTAVAACLRVIGLDEQLWFDEIVTLVNNVRLPLGTLIGSYTGENQHTLYAVLAKAPVALFGERPWTVRLPAMLMGVAAVPMLYLLGRVIADRREALAAALLLAVSYHHVWFSQNARAYTGLLLVAIVTTLCFILGWRTRSWRAWAVYAIALALGCWLHLTMVFVALAHGLITAGLAVQLASRRARLGPVAGPALALVLAAVLTVVLYAPALPELMAFLGQADPPLETQWSKPSWAAAEATRGLRFGYGIAGLIAGAALACLGAWRFLRESPMLLSLLILPGVLGLVTVVALHYNIRPRFFFYAFGFALIIVVRGAAVAAGALARFFEARGIAERAGFAALTGGMAFASLISLGPLYGHPKQDLLGPLSFVESRRSPEDVVLIAGWAQFPYLQYYGAPWQPVRDELELDRALASGRRVWLVYTFHVDLWARQPSLARRIEERFRPVRTFPAMVSGAQVYVLSSFGGRDSHPPPPGGAGV